MKRWFLPLAVACVLCFGYFAWPTPWRYDSLKRGERTVMVRTHRLTSTVQELGRSGWITLGASSASGLAGPVQIAPEQEIPPSDATALDGVLETSGERLRLSLHNGSAWTVTRVSVTVLAEGGPSRAAREYQLEHANAYRDIVQSGVGPKTTGTFEAHSGPMYGPLRWSIVKAYGFRDPKKS